MYKYCHVLMPKWIWIQNYILIKDRCKWIDQYKQTDICDVIKSNSIKLKKKIRYEKKSPKYEQLVLYVSPSWYDICCLHWFTDEIYIMNIHISRKIWSSTIFPVVLYLEIITSTMAIFSWHSLVQLLDLPLNYYQKTACMSHYQQ
jgi:hypothetical protein